MCGGFHSQLDDVWVSEQFEILDFPFDLPDDIEAADLLSVQDLHCHFMACQLMFTDCTMREHRREAEAGHRTQNTERRTRNAEHGTQTGREEAVWIQKRSLRTQSRHNFAFLSKPLQHINNHKCYQTKSQ